VPEEIFKIAELCPRFDCRLIMPAKLSTHVLDIAHGCPAHGMKIELWSLDGEEREPVTTVKANADGRPDQPLLSADEMQIGQYQIVFFVGDYFAAESRALPKACFLDRVPVRFGIADAAANYHIPLLCTPWASSTYRGS
jgi:5-hydroxyisourate hydrolase